MQSPSPFPYSSSASEATGWASALKPHHRHQFQLDWTVSAPLVFAFSGSMPHTHSVVSARVVLQVQGK